MTIAGIRRGNQFSPNHIGNDAAIFSLTAEHLGKLGCKVNEYIESDLLLQDLKEKAIFNMVRDWKSIHKLQELENNGHIVINSGYGIENCTREKMTRLLLDHHIPHPTSLFLSTQTDPTQMLEEAGLDHCWIKRGCNVCTQPGRSQKYFKGICHSWYSNSRDQRTSGRRPGEILRSYRN